MRNINGKEYPDDLCHANLRDANLRRADLRHADLCHANLRHADLQGASLRDANLRHADLCHANLRDADLQGADLRHADLCHANLRDADLQGASLRDANLRHADLRGADLRHANLRDADLYAAKGLEQTYVANEGDIIGYKKLCGDVICKLLIPADAKRSNATTRKCRAEYAVVLEGEGVSTYDETFEYKVGETVRPREPFDKGRWTECGSGIHFFITKQEAEEY